MQSGPDAHFAFKGWLSWLGGVAVLLGIAEVAPAADRRWIGYQFSNASNYPGASSFANNFAWSGSVTPGTGDNAILGEGQVALPNPQYPLTPYGPYNLFFGQFDEELFGGSHVVTPATNATVQDFVVKGNNTWRLDMGPGWAQDPNAWGTSSTGPSGSLTANGQLRIFGDGYGGGAPIVNVRRGTVTAGRVELDAVPGAVLEDVYYPTLNVTGPDGRVHDTASLAGGVELFRGYLNITDGGFVDSDTGWTEIYNKSILTVDGDGSHFRTQSPMDISNDARVTITNGGLVEVVDGEFWCGYKPGSRSITTISGTGSRLVENSVYPSVIGRNGAGSLIIQQQGSAKFGGLGVGLYGTTGAGTVTVASGTLETTGDMLVGVEEPGYLRVSQGKLTVGHDFKMAEAVTGVGTTVFINSTVSIASAMRVGINHIASMEILGASKARCFDGTVGEGINAVGTITVSGAGSLLHVDNYLTVGGYGTTGGGAGLGTVVVRDEGRLEVGNEILIKLRGTLTGDGTVVGNVFNSGTISPGNSPGLLTIDGNLRLDPASNIVMEIGGTTPGSTYDQLVVNGQAALGGVVDVVLVNGFIPAPGSTFDLFQFSSVLNGSTFAGINLPSGVNWDTSQLVTGGTLSVVPEPGGAIAAVLLVCGLARRHRRVAAFAGLNLRRRTRGEAKRGSTANDNGTTNLFGFEKGRR